MCFYLHFFFGQGGGSLAFQPCDTRTCQKLDLIVNLSHLYAYDALHCLACLLIFKCIVEGRRQIWAVYEMMWKILTNRTCRCQAGEWGMLKSVVRGVNMNEEMEGGEGRQSLEQCGVACATGQRRFPSLITVLSFVSQLYLSCEILLQSEPAPSFLYQFYNKYSSYQLGIRAPDIGHCCQDHELNCWIV